jgi:hypothetical protein
MATTEQVQDSEMDLPWAGLIGGHEMGTASLNRM